MSVPPLLKLQLLRSRRCGVRNENTRNHFGLFPTAPTRPAELHFYGGGPDLERLKAFVWDLDQCLGTGRKTNEEILKLSQITTH